jgi:arginine utilization regulatory protein
MVSYDIICFLDHNKIVKHIEYLGTSSNNDKVSVLNECIGKEIGSFFDIDSDKNKGYINWRGMVLRYTKTENVMGTGYILYITEATDKSKIYEAALDCVSEGIQVYDRTGHLLFCNKFNEKIEKMNRENIIGKHLLDIYDLKEEYSTALNTIKSKMSVINRCDNFKNKNSELITTMNSGYPLFIEDNLIGAAVIVQDTSVFKQYHSKMDSFDKFLSQGEKDKLNRKRKNFYALKYYSFDDLIGEDENFIEAIQLSRNIADRDCSVLIYGETGTGKELFAQSIHSESKRKNKEFVAVNCAAIPENLIEGILFGTEKGSFTGSSDRIGLFEQAEGGTLFLDEINSMNLHMQSKLLRVLQEKKLRRVGGLNDIECDVRIISSTNEEPLSLIENNKMRKDLYYRISTVTVNIPPLRNRKNDIDMLVQYFIEKLSRHYSKEVKGASPEVIFKFKEYDWPGNVRELLHSIEYAFNTMIEDIINVRDLPKYIQKQKKTNSKDTLHLRTLEEIMGQYEKEVIKNTLKRHKNNITKAANQLGVKRQSLQYRIKKYEL